MACYCKKFLARISVWQYIPPIFFVLSVMLVSATLFAEAEIDVVNVNSAPVLDTISAQTVNEGDLVSINPTGTEAVSCTLASKFQQGTLQNGETYYSDRKYTLTNVPAHYSGLDLIKTLNNDRNGTCGGGYMNFELTHDAIVFVAYDRRATKLPTWMDGFIFTGDIIDTSLKSQGWLKVYSKQFSTNDCVDLGCNKGPGFSGRRMSNYCVFYRNSVGAVNSAPELSPIGNKQTSEGVNLSFTISASDADGDALSYTAGNLPSGANFNEINKTFSWIPGFDQSGSYTDVSFSVSDGSDTVTEQINIGVTEVNRAPVLDQVSDITVVEGGVVLFTPTGIDPDGDILNFSYLGWMTTASYTTVAGDVGVHTVTVTASDGTLSASQDVTVSVTVPVPENRVPILVVIGNKQINEGELLNFSVTAVDDDGDNLTYTASNLPSGSSFDGLSRVFSWNPGFDQGGTYSNVDFHVSDGKDTTSESISIQVLNVNRGPVLATIASITVNEGEVVSINPTGTDPDGDVLSFSYSGWMTSASYTTVSGDVGIHTVTVTASDGTLSASQDVSVTVVQSTAAVTLSWTANTESDLGGYKIYYGLSSRVYPNVVDATNVTSYTLPIEAGVDVYLALTAYDTSSNESGYSSELVFNSSVGVVNSAPELSFIGNKQTSEGANLSFTISASDADGDALSYTAGNLPSGANFNEINKTFSWIPGFDQSGSYTDVSFSVSDGSDTVTEQINIGVTEVNRAPVLDQVSDITVVEGGVVLFTPTGIDPDGDILNFSYLGWMTTASYTTVAGDVGVHTVTVTASDGTLSASQDVTVSVTVPVPENRVPILVVIGNKQINEGELLNFSVTAVDDDGDNLTYTASNLPSGSSFDGLSRVFSWNPGFDQGGTYSNVDFHVSDGKDTTSESISIQVLNVNRGPVLATIASITVNEGEVVSINPTGTDPDGDVLSFSYSGWMTSASYTTVSGDVGIHTVTVTASDGTLSASQDVSVTVVQSTAAVTLSWTANTESDLGGYKIYYGLSSRVYPNVVDATNVTSYTLPIEAGVDVYLALTAYDTSGNESGFSSELI